MIYMPLKIEIEEKKKRGKEKTETVIFFSAPRIRPVN